MALGLLDPQDLVLFPVGAEVEGMLNIKGEKYPIQAKVVYAHRTLVGCELIQPSMVLAQALQRCLDPQVLGQELKRIPSLEGKSVWYHSKTGCDLIFFGTEASDVTRIQKILCCVLGSFIQWDKAQGLSTGSTRSAQHIPESWGLLSYETLVLSRDLKLDREKLNIAKKVVLSSNLETKLKDWCLKQFKEV